MKILTKEVPSFNYDGESDRDYYTKITEWYRTNLKDPFELTREEVVTLMDEINKHLRW
jgi:hypothetical protein